MRGTDPCKGPCKAVTGPCNEISTQNMALYHLISLCILLWHGTSGPQISTHFPVHQSGASRVPFRNALQKASNPGRRKSVSGGSEIYDSPELPNALWHVTIFYGYLPYGTISRFGHWNTWNGQTIQKMGMGKLELWSKTISFPCFLESSSVFDWAIYQWRVTHWNENDSESNPAVTTVSPEYLRFLSAQYLRFLSAPVCIPYVMQVELVHPQERWKASDCSQKESEVEVTSGLGFPPSHSWPCPNDPFCGRFQLNFSWFYRYVTVCQCMNEPISFSRLASWNKLQYFKILQKIHPILQVPWLYHPNHARFASTHQYNSLFLPRLPISIPSNS